MSQMTQTKYLLIASLIFSSLITSKAFAGSVEEALLAKERAQNNYYKTLHDYPTPPTTQDKARLKKEILEPAEKEFGKATRAVMSKTKDQVVKNLNGGASPSKNIAQGNSDSSRSPANARIFSGPSPSAPKQEGTKLDGKEIPKVIEFK